MYTTNIDSIKDTNAFDKQYLTLRKEGFAWAVYLLANEADSEMIYQDMMNDWTSIDAITGQDIVVVIANENSQNNYFFNKKLKRMSHFDDYQQSRNIPRANTTMSELATRYFKLSVMQWPCLVFVNLKDSNTKQIIVHLHNDTRMYDVMKYIVYRVKDLNKNLTTYTNDLELFENEQMYDELTARFRTAVIENNLCDDYIDNLIMNINDSYSFQELEQMLEELHSRKIWLYGDSKRSSIISRIKICRNRYQNFDERFEEYKSISERINVISDDIANVIQNIDVTNCSKDAMDYASQILENIGELDSLDAQLQASISELRSEMQNNINTHEIKEATLTKWKATCVKIEDITSKIEGNYAYRAFGILSSFQSIIQLLKLVL